jgi:hypothetical protein
MSKKIQYKLSLYFLLQIEHIADIGINCSDVENKDYLLNHKF